MGNGLVLTCILAAATPCMTKRLIQIYTGMWNFRLSDHATAHLVSLDLSHARPVNDCNPDPGAGGKTLGSVRRDISA